MKSHQLEHKSLDDYKLKLPPEYVDQSLADHRELPLHCPESTDHTHTHTHTDTRLMAFVGGTSLVSRLSACLTEVNWWRLIAE